MSSEKKQHEADVASVDSALPSNPPGLTAEETAELVHDMKHKLRSLAGTYEDTLEALSPNVRKRVDYLRDLQKQHDELQQKFLEERAALEDRYQKLFQPLYTKRFEIVSGKVEVEDGVDETKGGAASEEKEQGKVSDKAEVEENVDEAKEGTGSEEKEQEEKGIPEFWLNAMRSNEVLVEEIEDQDEEALKYLTDIKWQRIDDHKGFKLEFFFDPNPFFKNSVLTKNYIMIDEDEPILEKAIGTEIEWNPGKCLTQKILKKKAKDAKPGTKTEKCASFFNFFDPPKVPEDDEDLDEDSAEQLQNQIEEDYDVGSTIKNKIIPHAVSWFTREAIMDEDFDILTDEGEDDEEDEDEEEDDEDEEDEAEDKKQANKESQIS